MKKRVTLLTVVFLVIFLFTVTAQAAAPSITTSSLARTVTVQGATANDVLVPLTAEFTIKIMQDTKNVLDELGKILDFFQKTGLPVVEYFDYDANKDYSAGGVEDGPVKKQISLLLPAGFDLDTLELHEFVTAQPFFYEKGIGDVAATFEFATEYIKDQIIVAVIGVFDEWGNVEWIPLKAEVVEDPERDGVYLVQIYFTQESLVKIGDNPFALAILSEPVGK